MILITGCTGYIGSRLCHHLLLKGYKVCGLIKPSEREIANKLVNLGLIPFYNDLLEPFNLYRLEDEIDLIYHLAGVHSNYTNTYKLYVQGTINLFKAFSKLDHTKIVVASNGAVYPSTLKKQIEDLRISTDNIFGKITLEMEKVVMNMCNNYAIFRIGEVYGDGEFNPFRFDKKRITLLGNGMNYTSKIFIHDLINILDKCCDKFSHGIYNICDDLPIPQIEFYHYVEKLSKKKCVNLKSDIELNDRIILSIHGLRTMNIRMDNSLFKNTSGYKFIYPTYIEGLEYLNNYNI